MGSPWEIGYDLAYNDTDLNSENKQIQSEN